MTVIKIDVDAALTDDEKMAIHSALTKTMDSFMRMRSGKYGNLSKLYEFLKSQEQMVIPSITIQVE